MRALRPILALALAFGAASTSARAAEPIESRPVTFARGTSAATITGTLKGGQTVDYILRGLAGQSMSVAMKSSHAANHFNVLPPGSNDVAIFVGSTGGERWSGRLPKDGEYKIRVYLMRSAARRDEAARYTLTVGIDGGAAAAPLGKPRPGDAKVAGTPYHATGTVPCAIGAAGGDARCAFGVIRGTPGNAEVHVTPPGGTRRVLRFRGPSVSAGGAEKVTGRKSGDEWLVDVNDREHYRIPEAVISGG